MRLAPQTGSQSSYYALQTHHIIFELVDVEGGGTIFGGSTFRHRRRLGANMCALSRTPACSSAARSTHLFRAIASGDESEPLQPVFV